MAVRIPLVLDNAGEIEQLQAGDSIVIPAISGGTQVTQTNGEGSASIVAGNAVYASAADTMKLAKANAAGPAAVKGLWVSTVTTFGNPGVMQVDGILALATGLWDAVVTGGSGGLLYNERYLLDPANFGKLLPSSAFTNVAGQYLTVVGRGISTTEMELNIQDPILL